jgi:hypothetical protein
MAKMAAFRLAMVVIFALPIRTVSAAVLPTPSRPGKSE